LGSLKEQKKQIMKNKIILGVRQAQNTLKKKLVVGTLLAYAGVINAQWSGTSPNPISTSQNVGIGTTSPANKLQIDVSTADDGIVVNQTNNGAGSSALYLKNNYGHTWSLHSTGPANNVNANHFVLYDITQNNSPRLFISGNNGNVGIGTTNPQALLDVNGGFTHMTFNSYNANGPILPQTDPTGGLSVGWNKIGTEVNFYNVYGSATRSFLFSQKTANSVNDLMIINSNGNVGIGHTSPTAQLHLASDADHDLLMTNKTNGSYGFRIHRDAATNTFHFQIGTGFSGGTTWETKIQIKENEGANTKLLLNPTGGRVGIGTTSPMTDLHIQTGSAPACLRVASSGNYDTKVNIANAAGGYDFRIDASGYGHIGADNGGTNLINFARSWPNNSPQVWIGAHKPISPHDDFSFAVEGKVLAQSIYVTASTQWADYVFAPDYKLPNLLEVEAYYKENRHLPEIPTAREIEEKGINVGDMNTLLLKKIEELTLYVVELEKKQKEQAIVIAKLKN
jgi:hypothetical protein